MTKKDLMTMFSVDFMTIRVVVKFFADPVKTQTCTVLRDFHLHLFLTEFFIVLVCFSIVLGPI